jgi:hypothetical protein
MAPVTRWSLIVLAAAGVVFYLLQAGVFNMKVGIVPGW